MVGDVLDVSGPAGDFVVESSSEPLLLAKRGSRHYHGVAHRGAHRAAVYGARYRHLTTREHNKLRPTRPRPSSPPLSCATHTR
jgi:hypothetical protein